MRELKFRAWDQTKLRYVGQLDWLWVNFLGRIRWWDGETTSNRDDLLVERFTGLLDRNGTEIFQGDIVECFGPREPAVVEWKDGGFGYRVPYDFVWLGHNYHFKWKDGQSQNIVVVGNLHENPELVPAPKRGEREKDEK